MKGTTVLEFCLFWEFLGGKIERVFFGWLDLSRDLFMVFKTIFWLLILGPI